MNENNNQPLKTVKETIYNQENNLILLNQRATSKTTQQNNFMASSSTEEKPTILSKHEKNQKLLRFIAAKVDDITFRNYDQDNDDDLNAVEKQIKEKFHIKEL